MLRLGSRTALRVSVVLRPVRFQSAAASHPPFKKILVANRGEIACRVMKTAKRLGIKTVAVYSEADAQALHVRLADEAVCVGPAPSAQSYLNAKNIMDAMRSTGAEALHPGYGFFSENTEFAKQLEQEGFVFIGPGAFAIKAMGDKIESKKLAAAAGVNVIPGFNDIIRDDAHAIEIARQIGYPVMIKASAGGGGKGMRVAYNDDEAKEGFRLSTNEAKSSFNDDRIFIEKFIENPRHIEIQIIADKHGNAVYLNERECSIQRRNQKVIEEAPSVLLDEATRAAMGKQAVALAHAVDYCSAGTVEMIVDQNKNFYFLEMNTRLQVEHPVTEYITGLDLVELMIQVAAGQKLPLKQEDVKIQGWSLECRVYAEDASNNFLPSIGRLTRYVEPSTDGGEVRVDTGVKEGSEISIYYDPLISKLVTHGATRQEAITRMEKALDNYVIRGVTNNSPFLRSILTHPRFVAGALTTNFIAEEWPEGYTGHVLDDAQRRALIATAAALHVQRQQIAATVTGRLASASPVASTGDRSLAITLAGESSTATVLPVPSFDLTRPATSFNVDIAGCQVSVAMDTPPQHNGLFDATVDGTPLTMQLVERGVQGVTLLYMGSEYPISVKAERHAELTAHLPEKVAPDHSKQLLSPMPGVVTSIAVQVGDTVTKGQELAVVEAMKMQNVLRSAAPGVVKTIHSRVGSVVVVEECILELE